jgi:hypothetical protein
VYDDNHVLIPPLQYEFKLKGVFIEVHVAICHNRVKSKKRDVFNAVLRELIVLSPSAAMPNSPKASNVTASMLNLAQNNVTKVRSLWEALNLDVYIVFPAIDLHADSVQQRITLLARYSGNS